MPEQEAKVAQEGIADENSKIDSKVDEIFDGQEKAKPEDTSSSNEAADTETEESKDTGADQQKPEKSEEAKEEVPKEFHKHPAWQRIMKERDEAKKAVEGLKESSLSTEEMKELRNTISSPEYIQTRMKAQGYTQEAIDSELRKKGFDIPERPGDDVALVINKLGLDSVDEETRGKIGDFAKIANVIFMDRFGKLLPKQLQPLQESLGKFTQEKGADELYRGIKETVESEGTLDFEKDIEPEVNKWIDEQEKAGKEIFQDDIRTFFDKLNHKLCHERWQKGAKKKERDSKKPELKSAQESTTVDKSGRSLKMGENEDKFLDDELDRLGVQ